MKPGLSTLRPDEHDAAADLIHRALVHWYESKLGQGNRFGGEAAPFLIFPEVYQKLDPGEAITMRNEENGALLGLCFVHPRETHHSVGIVVIDPQAAGRGIAATMMREAIRRAEAAGKPLRLVSSLMNLDSYSLYTRLGFVPGEIYQDISFSIPDSGFPTEKPPEVDQVRLALPDEAAAIADFELATRGLRREVDYAYFLSDPEMWRVWVKLDAKGSMCGFLVACMDSRMPMLGPGVSADEETALALTFVALDAMRGRSVVLLAPAIETGLIASLYRWGGRNVELHVAQCRGFAAAARGIAFPTFLPESG